MRTREAKRWLQGTRILILSLMATTVGCGNFFVPPDNSGGDDGGGGTSTSRVYVMNATAGANTTTGSIAGFTIANGTLTPVPNSPMAVQFQPLAAIVSPNNAFLYVAGPSSINVYAINSDGSLTALNNGVVISVASLDISPDGQWLFGLDLQQSNLDEFQIDASSGGLSALTPQPLPALTGTMVPQMVKVSPTGNLVFCALGTGGDRVFTLNTTSGTLTYANQALQLNSASTSDNALATDSTGTYLYIARAGTNGGIAVYTIGGGGVLTAIAGSPFAAGNRPFSIALDKTGKYLYAANRTDGTISGYTIGAGALTAISGFPITSGLQVNSLGADSSGTYLLAGANGGNPDLSLYSFDATTLGKLNLTTSTATDTDPTNVTQIALTH
ncbi:lactonase family protein [Edaphobacter modestus]|uniref:lactonase family protein n=1 Tax=Edaphobacter modestus TaxID=388466 RepID=UPI0013EEDA32|nr:beta-propeller fold lactonase family protein [Edaphobacter modestus]